MASFQSILDSHNDSVTGGTARSAQSGDTVRKESENSKKSEAPTWQERYQKADITKHERKKTAKQRVSIISLLLAVTAIAACVALMFSYSRITVLDYDISKAKDQLESLQNDSVKLKTQYEARYNLTNIEEYAQKTLGMTKLDSSQIEYIEINNPDTITRVTGSGFSFSVVGDFLAHAVNAVIDVFE